MAKNLYLTATLLFSLLSVTNSTAQTGCPGCSVSLPPLPADTIYLSDAPDGEAGVYYSGDISFRMPKTTTPVNDPGTPAGLDINKITIVSVLNVPPGLQWEANQNVFNPQDETDGCVKFCGVPLQPGLYEVEVYVTAEVSIFNQSTSFSFPIYIAPATSTTDGFAMQNSAGCGSVTVDFQNKVPSNGDAGYSYLWDFGNGETSVEENPGPQTYSTPGVYEINYEASIDTFGYQLATVQVLDAGCYDPISIPPADAPDLYIKIKNPQGNIIFETSPIDNVPFPAAFNVNLFLMDGIYRVEVRDDDVIGSQACGEVPFTRYNLPTDTLISGDLIIKLNIIHPISTIQSTDTVFVYEIPAPPVISPFGEVEVCQGEAVELTVNYDSNLQWYRDTTLLLNQTSQTLAPSQEGSYWVIYTSPDGCQSQSEAVVVSFLPNPQAPAFQAEGNLLVLNNPASLPANYSLQWYVNGVLEPGATDLEFCMSLPGTSLYTLVVTDEATACTNEFSLGATYDPDVDCFSADAEPHSAGIQNLRVFPNPFSDLLNVSFSLKSPQDVSIKIVDGTGRTVALTNLASQLGWVEEKLEVSSLASGIYFIYVLTESGVVSSKIIKR